MTAGFSMLEIAACLIGGALGTVNDPVLAPERLFNGLDQPLMVQINADASARIELAMMDVHGLPVGDPAPVAAGHADLGELLPDLWLVREAVYIQLLVDSEPTGSAVVLQPLLTPMKARTEEQLLPTGESVVRVVEWQEPEPRVFSGFRAYLERDVLLNTSEGAIRLAMRPDEAPNTVWNFLSLVQGRLYDGTSFHRVVPMTASGERFVIQGGDPSSTGSGGPGYGLPLEPSGLEHDFGVISMARTDDPDSAGSQFFICLSREGTARLDGQYCAFGYAVSGAQTINSIADTKLADVAGGRPAQPPVIYSAELIPAPARRPGLGRPDQRVREHEQTDEQPARQGGRVPR